MEFSSVPTVASGHTLQLITAAIDEYGNVAAVKTQDNPVADHGYFEQELDETVTASTKQWAVSFFADFDGNGVLQAISASVAQVRTITP